MKAEVLTFPTSPPLFILAFTSLRYRQVLPTRFLWRSGGKINVTWNSHVTFILPPPVSQRAQRPFRRERRRLKEQPRPSKPRRSRATREWIIRRCDAFCPISNHAKAEIMYSQGTWTGTSAKRNEGISEEQRNVYLTTDAQLYIGQGPQVVSRVVAVLASAVLQSEGSELDLSEQCFLAGNVCLLWLF